MLLKDSFIVVVLVFQERKKERERERERRALQDRKFGKKEVSSDSCWNHRDTNGIKRRENQQIPFNDKGEGEEKDCLSWQQHDSHTRHAYEKDWITGRDRKIKDLSLYHRCRHHDPRLRRVDHFPPVIYDCHPFSKSQWFRTKDSHSLCSSRREDELCQGIIIIRRRMILDVVIIGSEASRREK